MTLDFSPLTDIEAYDAGLAATHPLMEAAFSADWLMAQRFPPAKYVVPGIIPEGMTLLVAAPKIGKSWMVLGLALELHKGGLAFGAIPTGRPRPVLYLALEDGPRRLQDRLIQLVPGTVTDKLTFLVNVQSGQVINTINLFMSQHAGSDPVVILDTLGKVMPSAPGRESAYGHDYKMLSALKATTDAVPGSSLVIVHHTRKQDGADFLDAVSGTQGIAGAADTVLLLKRERNERKGTLQVTSRDAAEGEYALILSGIGRWELDGADLAEAAAMAETAKQTEGVGDRMAEIISTVSRYPEGVRRKDIAELLHMDENTSGRYLRRATESGRIFNPSRGLYTPVSSVSSVSNVLDEQDTRDKQDTPSKETCPLHPVPHPKSCFTCDSLQEIS